MESKVSNEADTSMVQNIGWWRPPHQRWLMCNVAFEWDKEKGLMGGAWVVRNYRGVVLIHHRRTFFNVLSLDEARLRTILWAVESMTSLHFNKIIFTGDFEEMFCAVEKPHQWYAFRQQGEEIKLKLNLMEEYQLRVVLNML